MSRKSPKQNNPKPLSAYNTIQVYVRADREYLNVLKSKAALTGRPFQDCVRDWLDFAIENTDDSFAGSGGNENSRTGKS